MTHRRPKPKKVNAGPEEVAVEQTVPVSLETSNNNDNVEKASDTIMLDVGTGVQ